LGQKEILIGFDGEQAQYPFDDHAGLIEIIADNDVKNSDGSLTSANPVDSGILGTGGVNGWDTTFDATSGVVAPPSPTLAIERAFSRQAFALLLLVLAVLLAVFAITVHRGGTARGAGVE
jgi:hypothetical protein